MKKDRRKKSDSGGLLSSYHRLRRMEDELNVLSDHGQYSDPDLLLPELSLVLESLENYLKPTLLSETMSDDVDDR